MCVPYVLVSQKITIKLCFLIVQLNPNVCRYAIGFDDANGMFVINSYVQYWPVWDWLKK